MKKVQTQQVPRLFLPLVEPEDVIQHLGRSEYHWKEGYSAHALVNTWFSANDIPAAVRSVLSSNSVFRGAELIDGFLERKVDLRSAGQPSQADLLAVIGLEIRIAVLAVEGKVDETFGELVEDWRAGPKKKPARLASSKAEHEARKARLRVLCKTLNLTETETNRLRYQLLHRTASAIYEAKRYRTDIAGMLVHSFSKRASGFDDFCAFVKAMGIKAGVQPNVLIGPVQCDNISLYMGWVTDAAPIAESPSQYVERLRRYVQKLSAWCDRVRAVCDNRFQA